ncbi:MAG: DUF2490 domain-containing protein [Bacteroidales bacterium]|nr:DUF2490 domain-containing protein [Bacteroidales bacterium]
MKKRVLTIALIVFAGFGFPSLKAQTDVDLDPEFGGRLSVSVDKKLARGLHVSLEEEIRMDNNFGSFDRFHTTLGLSYKVSDYLKLSVGYAMINPYSSSNSAFKSSRHRLMLDATGSLRFGDWRLSLRERFQATYRSGDMNEYQNPRTALTLKSRLKLSYKGLRRLEPYAYIELRNTLNAPVISASYDGTNYLTSALSQYGEAGWFIDSWSGVYVNRVRGSVGFDYRLSKASSIDVSLMADRIMDKVVDANAEGTKLKSYTRETGFVGWINIGYSYSF